MDRFRRGFPIVNGKHKPDLLTMGLKSEVTVPFILGEDGLIPATVRPKVNIVEQACRKRAFPPGHIRGKCLGEQDVWEWAKYTATDVWVYSTMFIADLIRSYPTGRPMNGYPRMEGIRQVPTKNPRRGKMLAHPDWANPLGMAGRLMPETEAAKYVIDESEVADGWNLTPDWSIEPPWISDNDFDGRSQEQRLKDNDAECTAGSRWSSIHRYCTCATRTLNSAPR